MRALRVATWMTVVAAVVAVAGCGGSPGDDAAAPASSGTSGTSGPTATPTEPSVTPTEPPVTRPEPPVTPTEPTTDPTTSPPVSGDPTTLTGVVEAGVETGCLLLEGHLLLGGETDDGDLLQVGRNVRVTGHVEKNMMSTCQQGIPFRVETVEPLD